jgi:hypothetical protein
MKAGHRHESRGIVGLSAVPGSVWGALNPLGDAFGDALRAWSSSRE